MKVEGDYIVFSADEARAIVRKPVTGDGYRIGGIGPWYQVGYGVRTYDPVYTWEGRRRISDCSEHMKTLAGVVAHESEHFI